MTTTQKPRIGVALEDMGWTVDMLGSRGRGRLVATRSDLPQARVEVDYKYGVDRYQSWRYLSDGKEIANNYTSGDLLDWLRERTQ